METGLAKLVRHRRPKGPVNGQVWPAPKRHTPTLRLTDGNLFFAGNGPEFAGKTESYHYSVGTKSWTDQKTSGFLGGSAVYWPALNDSDRVMKCGGDDDVTTEDEVKTGMHTIGSQNWNRHEDLPESRTYHNLTLLPDGRVLLTGGKTRSSGPPPINTFTKIPRIWDRVVKDWETNPALQLAPDPGNRGYHSTALLLPDARVLCAGGPGVGSGDWRASIYTPPYLYDATGNLAQRPSITSVLPEPGYPPIHNGEPFWVGVSQTPLTTIDKVSLIRAGAPTHGFDQNQRYMTAAFTKDYANNRLRIVMPNDHNLVPPGDYLMFVLKSNGVPSVARWVRVQDENDTQNPGAVSNLGWVQGPGPSTVTVYWTTQADDGGPSTKRAAAMHELCYSNSPITDEASWGSASVLWSGNARPAGEAQSVALVGLDCTPLYFAVKTQDEVGHWSALSNSSEYNCEGGGLASRRAGGDEGEHITAAIPQGTSIGFTRLIGAASAAIVSLDVVNVGASAIRVDSLGLVVAAEPSGQLALTSGGQVALGNRLTPAFVRSSSAGDVTARIDAGDPYQATAGEALVVRGASEATHLLIETAAADGGNTPTRTGIELEIPTGEGWAKVESCFPSAGEDSWLVPVAGDSVRLLFRGAYTVKDIDWVVPTSSAPELTEAPRTGLEHSVEGTIDPAVSLAAGTLVLDPGERVTVGFADAPSSAAGRFLALGTSSPGATAPARNIAARPPPAAFSLGQNEPNPFGEGTLIRFALPIRSQVRLEVFDIRGRRVKALTQGEWPAGQHAVEWNARDNQGQRVGPGVYLYRMEAGSFRASRKLVVSP